MKLTKEEYQRLEDIVGREYITQEPVIGESYNQVWGNKLEFGKKHTTPPAAILLPATTGEIKIDTPSQPAGVTSRASCRAEPFLNVQSTSPHKT